MKKNCLFGTLALSALIATTSCKKTSNEETVVISRPQFQAGQAITSDTLSGAVKGTMVSGKTYYFASPVTINAGDTLLMQSGVKLLALNPTAQLVVKGSFISLGSKDAPNWITGKAAYENPAVYKLTTYKNQDDDPALKVGESQWGGIQCDVTANMVNIKWTHLEFIGGDATVSPFKNIPVGGNFHAIFFENADGFLIIEDSWFYGCIYDAARVNGGKIHIMRNTAEKMGNNNSDVFNVKNSVRGDMAYNLIIGSAKGGTKLADKGSYGTATTPSFPANVTMYNNTYICGGWRDQSGDRGADINFEDGKGMGLIYNNIMVNCKRGILIRKNPLPDTANIKYGNNFNYGDSLVVVNAFYPIGHVTQPKTSDLPNPLIFLPSSYVLGQNYDGKDAININNPKFVNYPLPQQNRNYALSNFVGMFNFRLSAGSPAIGKGYTSFAPYNATSAVTNEYLKATVTPPSKDLGAYPTDDSGNQH